MAEQDVYRELAKRLMMENSETVREIWRIVCSEEEAAIVARMPATVDELCEAFGKGREEMQAVIDGLFARGAVFDYVKDGVTMYRGPRHIVQFHDATILWPDAPPELFDLWRSFSETDYPGLLELVTSLKLPSFMRVIPIGETVEARNQVLAFEDAAAMLGSAREIAVTTCVCRKLMGRCDAPLEVCLQLDRGAEYTIKRGTGRRVDVGEALEILARARDAGLVHMTENTAGRSNVLCNCCSCCCEMLRFATDTRTKGVVAPSRFRPRVDAGTCSSCGACAEVCPVGAMGVPEGGTAVVDEAACIGCGLCANSCPLDAIQLVEVRPREFIPGADRAQ